MFSLGQEKNYFNPITRRVNQCITLCFSVHSTMNRQGQSDLGYSTRWKADPRCTMATSMFISSNLLHRSTKENQHESTWWRDASSAAVPQAAAHRSLLHSRQDEREAALITPGPSNNQRIVQLHLLGEEGEPVTTYSRRLGGESRVQGLSNTGTEVKMSWLIEPLRLISGLTWLLLVQDWPIYNKLS